VSTVSCSKPSSANSAARWQRTSRTSASSKSENHSLELHSLNWKYSSFFLLGAEPFSVTTTGHSFYKHHFRAWTTTHPQTPLHISSSCSAQFPLFNDTNKHVLPNCITVAVKVATNTTAHEFCNDPLIDQLQEWSGGAGWVLGTFRCTR
jgi:hypothetical protein